MTYYDSIAVHMLADDLYNLGLAKLNEQPDAEEFYTNCVQVVVDEVLTERERMAFYSAQPMFE